MMTCAPGLPDAQQVAIGTLASAVEKEALSTLDFADFGDFEKVLSGYDVVVNSLGKDTLEKSLNVLKPGGKLISISGPPDAAFAKESGLNWFIQQVMRLLSFGIRKKAKKRGHQLLVCFHAGERRAVEQDYVTHR